MNTESRLSWVLAWALACGGKLPFMQIGGSH